MLFKNFKTYSTALSRCIQRGMMVAGFFFAVTSLAAAETMPVTLTIKDHQFSPAEIHLPAQQAAQIMVENKDATAEEFESTTLGVEKVIIGEGRGVVRIHPMPPGRYSFIGEYHADTAKGVVIVE